MEEKYRIECTENPAGIKKYKIQISHTIQKRFFFINWIEKEWKYHKIPFDFNTLEEAKNRVEELKKEEGDDIITYHLI